MRRVSHKEMEVCAASEGETSGPFACGAHLQLSDAEGASAELSDNKAMIRTNEEELERLRQFIWI